MRHIADVYASQMDELARGIALWYPEGQDDADDIRIGDVGYISEGVFIELFNALLPADHTRNRGKQVPPGHEPYKKREILMKNMANAMDPGVYSSRSVRHSKVAGDAGA